MRKAMPIEQVGVNCCADTVLRLELPSASLSQVSTSKEAKRKWSETNGPIGPEDGCSLALGLGEPMSSPCSTVVSSATMSSAKKTRDRSFLDLGLDFDLKLGNEKYLSPKKSSTAIPGPNFNLELSLSTVPAESSVTSVSLGSISLKNLEEPVSGNRVLMIDEGSTSSCRRLGNAGSQSHALLTTQSSFITNKVPGKADAVSKANAGSNVSDSAVLFMTKDSINSASGTTQSLQRHTYPKICQFNGCGKGARGSSGLCISHGGGRRCQRVGCNKGAEGRTAYCKGHGGGRRCQYLGCTKSAEGRTDHCIAHGGGRRCSHDSCTRAARGKTGLCIRHGGGKRCQKENCTRSAEGLSGLCISHGGGRRCQFPECTKGAQGSTMLCKAHGGGKRCTALGCTKGAEGSTPFCKGHGGGKRCSFQGGGICPKSVHGGTLFCVAHGGGKRCTMPECTKSARGRTDYCVRHGGGKRCKSEGCGKSAQGSTDYCKAHGGGRRCTWGQSGFEIGDQAATPCDRMARGRIGLCASHSALLQDKQVHGGGTLKPRSQDVKHGNLEKMKEVVVEETLIDVVKPSGIGSNLQGWEGFGINRSGEPEFSLQVPPQTLKPGVLSIPEGRVHGGNLMTMLARDAGFIQSSDSVQYAYPPFGGNQNHR